MAEIVEQGVVRITMDDSGAIKGIQTLGGELDSKATPSVKRLGGALDSAGKSGKEEIDRIIQELKGIDPAVKGSERAVARLHLELTGLKASSPASLAPAFSEADRAIAKTTQRIGDYHASLKEVKEQTAAATKNQTLQNDLFDRARGPIGQYVGALGTITAGLTAGFAAGMKFNEWIGTNTKAFDSFTDSLRNGAVIALDELFKGFEGDTHGFEYMVRNTKFADTSMQDLTRAARALGISIKTDLGEPIKENIPLAERYAERMRQLRAEKVPLGEATKRLGEEFKEEVANLNDANARTKAIAESTLKTAQAHVEASRLQNKAGIASKSSMIELARAEQNLAQVTHQSNAEKADIWAKASVRIRDEQKKLTDHTKEYNERMAEIEATSAEKIREIIKRKTSEAVNQKMEIRRQDLQQTKHDNEQQIEETRRTGEKNAAAKKDAEEKLKAILVAGGKTNSEVRKAAEAIEIRDIEQQARRIISILHLHGEEKVALEKAVAEQIKKITQKSFLDIEAFEGVTYRTLLNSISQLGQAFYASQERMHQEAFDRRQAMLDKNRAMEIAAAEAQGKSTTDIEAKYKNLKNKLAKRAFDDNKKMREKEALISAAAATINGLATQPFLYAGVVAGALAAALGLIQIREIQKSQYTPQAHGGIMPGNRDTQTMVVRNDELVADPGTTASLMNLKKFADKAANWQSAPAPAGGGGQSEILLRVAIERTRSGTREIISDISTEVISGNARLVATAVHDGRAAA